MMAMIKPQSQRNFISLLPKGQELCPRIYHQNCPGNCPQKLSSGIVSRNWPRQLSQDIILNLYHSLTELALYVLSFLHPRDLLRAAQTCRYWRILAEDNLLWREKCREVRKIVPIIIPLIVSAIVS